MTKNEIIENYFGCKVYADDAEREMNDPSNPPDVVKNARGMYEDTTRAIAEREAQFPWLIDLNRIVKELKDA
jgi:hypothetical protein